MVPRLTAPATGGGARNALIAVATGPRTSDCGFRLVRRPGSGLIDREPVTRAHWYHDRTAIHTLEGGCCALRRAYLLAITSMREHHSRFQIPIIVNRESRACCSCQTITFAHSGSIATSTACEAAMSA